MQPHLQEKKKSVAVSLATGEKLVAIPLATMSRIYLNFRLYKI
jgi:hypothetical protein